MTGVPRSQLKVSRVLHEDDDFVTLEVGKHDDVTVRQGRRRARELGLRKLANESAQAFHERTVPRDKTGRKKRADTEKG